MSGYSDTPLVQKLGFKPELNIKLVNPPSNYVELLKTDLNFSHDKFSLDAVHFFTKSQYEFTSMFPLLKGEIKKSGMLWISWPKLTSNVETDLDEGFIRRFAISQGLVDVKVCAIDDTWSAIKLVYRISDR